MSFSLLWFIIGIGTTLAVQAFYQWTKEKGYHFKWWQWLILACWVLAFAGTIGFIGTTYGEGDPRAALVGGAVFGVIVIVAAVGLWRWLFTVSKKESAGETVKM